MKAIRRKLLYSIAYLSLQNQYPPSMRDLCKAVGLRSTNSLPAHLKSLKLLGYISWEPTVNRSLHMTKGGWQHLVGSELAKRRENLNLSLMGVLREHSD